MIKKLKKYEGTFKEVQQNFMRALTRAELEEIQDVVAHYGLMLIQKNCSKCVFDFMVKVANLYYSEIAKVSEDTPITTPKNKSTKKNGRTTKKCTGNDRSASE